MSDNIPFDIQMEIIKKVDVKSLIQFRSVSKPWKSFIDSSDFIKGYGARHTQPHSCILSYKSGLKGTRKYIDTRKYIYLVDDDIETFKVQEELAPSVISPLLKQYCLTYFVGTCHGLLCLYGYNKVYNKKMVVIWNPYIRKSFGIAAVPGCGPQVEILYGFAVCPVTSDPTVVKVVCKDNKPWHVEVFTLSSGVWNVIPSGNMPRQSIRLYNSTQVVIDRYIYWGAREKTFAANGEVTTNQMVVSFDLITNEFKIVNLPDSITNLTNELISRISVSELRGSLVVYISIYVDGAQCCGVWVMEHDSSFRKLFTIDARVDKILAFKKNGETLFETPKEGIFSTLEVYDPCSQQIKNLGISGTRCFFFMGSYKESLLLLDHSDLHIHCDGN